MKFSQNPDLWEILDKTENRELVEAAHYDKIWGIGLRAEDAILLDVSQWLGENKLGMAIMETRAVLRSHPELIVLTKSNEEKKFSFYDSLGQKIIRLNNTELAQSLNCSVDNLELTLNNLEEDIKLPYSPFVQDTMNAKREDLLNSLNSSNNIYKKKLNR